MDTKFSAALHHTDPITRKEALDELADSALPRGKDGSCNDFAAMTAAIALTDDTSAEVRRAAIMVQFDVCMNAPNASDDKIPWY